MYVVHFLPNAKMYLVVRIPFPVSTSTYFHLSFVSLSLNLESINSSRLAGQWAVGICLSLCPIHSSQQIHILIYYKCVLLCLEFTSVLEIQTYILLLSQQPLYPLNHPKSLFKNQSDIITYIQSHVSFFVRFHSFSSSDASDNHTEEASSKTSVVKFISEVLSLQ